MCTLKRSQDIARRASHLVHVTYEELPVIVTIEQAIASKSFYVTKSIVNGNVDEGFAQSPHIIEGEVRIGGQEHFYLETQACICVPKPEHGAMEVITSTQSLNHTQHSVAAVLGVPNNRIVCKVTRLGGGFGGKESRSVQVALCTAVAARKLKRPVRCVLTRQEDMMSTGGRNPFLGRYKVMRIRLQFITLDCTCGFVTGWFHGCGQGDCAEGGLVLQCWGVT